MVYFGKNVNSKQTVQETAIIKKIEAPFPKTSKKRDKNKDWLNKLGWAESVMTI